MKSFLFLALLAFVFLQAPTTVTAQLSSGKFYPAEELEQFYNRLDSVTVITEELDTIVRRQKFSRLDSVRMPFTILFYRYAHRGGSWVPVNALVNEGDSHSLWLKVDSLNLVHLKFTHFKWIEVGQLAELQLSNKQQRKAGVQSVTLQFGLPELDAEGTWHLKEPGSKCDLALVTLRKEGSAYQLESAQSGCGPAPEFLTIRKGPSSWLINLNGVEYGARETVIGSGKLPTLELIGQNGKPAFQLYRLD